MLRTLSRRVAAVDLNDPRTTRRAEIAVPLLFGFVSLLLGVDANWDLYNYHLYNPFALLNGKLRVDLAPAGFQSYFNPLLDIPYYLMSRSLPAPLIAFLMGLLHGANFVLLLRIARRVLVGLPAGDENRVPLLLALAGVLTANFLSELGNTMGDNATALFCLGSLLLLLSRWESLAQPGRASLARIAGAGLVMGLGVGLKLTNATFAAALCAALLCIPATVFVRLRATMLCGIGVTLGVVATAGYWHHEMWTVFGNPLFPQFSALFPNPLSSSVMVADDRWLPKGVLETALWPFLFSLDSHRVGQVSLRQAIWPIVYVAFFAWLVAGLVLRLPRAKALAIDPRARFVVVFVAVAYVLWMKLFSIQRYLVAVELLAPLVAFVLLSALFDYGRARRVAAWLLGLATALVLAGGVQTWGHKTLSLATYDVEVPAIELPSRTTAFIVGNDPPWAWLATFFPPEVSFIQMGGNFPEGPAFRTRVREMASGLGGPTFAVFEGMRHHRRENIATANEYAARWGLSSSEAGCKVLRWAVTTFRARARYEEAGETAMPRCALAVRPEDEMDLEAANAAEQAKARVILAAYGFALVASECRSYRGRVGQGIAVYQWCRVDGARHEDSVNASAIGPATIGHVR